LAADKPLFTSQNRSFRYGDGVFETMKFYRGKIILDTLHFDRLFLGLKMLQIEHRLMATELSQFISELCQKNNCMDLARVRLAVFRNEENRANYVIEASELSDEVNRWNEKGLRIDLYPYSRKNADAFSNLKSANFLPYVLAGLYAKEKGIDDAIVLNAFNLICDSSKANIFLIRNKEIFTPSLHQGCVSGVMRRFLLDELKKNGYRVHQEEISEQDMEEADEVFLTNSIYDIRWVQSFRGKKYSFEACLSIYKLIKPILYSI